MSNAAWFVLGFCIVITVMTISDTAIRCMSKEVW